MPPLPSRVSWLRAALPQVRILLSLKSKPRVRIAMACLDRWDELGYHMWLTPDTAIVFIDRKLKSLSALAVLAHELLHIHHGIGHTGRFARASRRAGLDADGPDGSKPRAGLRKRLSRISTSLGPYPKS